MGTNNANALELIQNSVDLIDIVERMQHTAVGAMDRLERISKAVGKPELMDHANDFAKQQITIMAALLGVAQTANRTGRALLAEQN